MKRMSLKLFILMIIAIICICPQPKDAQAMLDVGSLATQVPNTIASVESKVTTYTNKIAKQTLQMYKSVKDFFNSLFSRKNTSIPGTKKIKESKVADVSSEEEIRKVFPQLFFRYPSSDVNEQLKYKHKGKEFYEDTVIEAFTAVRELEKKLMEIDQDIVTAEQNYTKADDLNGGLYNKFMISGTANNVMMTIQELVAIKAQLVSAIAVYHEVEPLYMEDNGKSSGE